jgi:cell shape-determining protein MreC
MPRVKFGHTFTVLMLLSSLSALVIPPTQTQRYKPNVQALFLPVSWPATGVGRWIAGRMGNEQGWNDRRNAEAIKAENAELRTTVFNLTERLNREMVKSAQREAVSPKLRENGVFVRTLGGDAGTRQTMLLPGPLPAGVANGMYAAYSGGVVGIVQNVGIAGAHVRLVTDVGFRVKCRFARLRRNEAGRPEMVPIPGVAVVVEGAGNNTLKVVKTGLTMDDVKKGGLLDADGKLVEGVWAYVDKDDPDWPQVFAGVPVGQIERVAPRDDAPLFADVTLRPATNLARLREVLVVTKE